MKNSNEECDFEKSNRATQISTTIREVERHNETFELKFEKSNRARHRKFRREISTTNSARKIKELEFETRIEN